MAYIKGEPFVQQFVDTNGNPLALGTLSFFLTGTSTPTPVYSDSAGTSLGTVVTLDTNGAPKSSGGTPVDLYFDTAITYKIVLKNAAGNAIPPTIDPFYPSNAVAVGLTAAGVSYTPAGTGAVATTVQAELRKTHRSSNFSTIAEAITAATGATLIIDSAVTVTVSANWPENIVTRVEKGGSITINNGVTLGILGDFEAGLFKVFYYVGTGTVEFSSYKCPVLHPEWWGLQADNLSASSTANRTALEACNAAFTDNVGALQLGGTIQLPHGSIYIDRWDFVGGDRVIKGHGMHATRLIGVGAGDYTVRIFDSGRCHFADLGIDGNSVKQRSLQIASTIGSSATGHKFDSIILAGAVADGLYVDGGPPDIHDLSTVQFNNCQFVCSGATSSQIYLTGDNTIAWTFNTCIIYGTSAIGVKTSAACTFIDSNFANNSSWNIQSISSSNSSGQLKCYGCHSEGTGGFFNTLASDVIGLASSQHIIDGHAGSNTGVNTSNMAIKHEAFRTLSIRNSFFNRNIEIDAGVGGEGLLDVHNVGFESGYGFVLTEGKIQGSIDGSQILRTSGSIKANVSGAYQAAVGSAYVDLFASTQVTALSASDVNVSSNGVGVYLLQNLTIGGTALVFHVGGATPVIMQSSGTSWVVAAPGANEVQIKDRGVGLGISVRAHASTNNNQITCTRINTK